MIAIESIYQLGDAIMRRLQSRCIVVVERYQVNQELRRIGEWRTHVSYSSEVVKRLVSRTVVCRPPQRSEEQQVV